MNTSALDRDPLEYATKYYWQMSYSEFIKLLFNDLVLAA